MSFRDYAANDTAIGKATVMKYKGQSVEVSSRIDSINASFGEAIISLSSGNEFDFTTCDALLKGKGEWVYDLQNGQYATLVCGNVNEILESPQMKNCLIKK